MSKKIALNMEPQFYKGVRIRLIKRNYTGDKAKRFMLGNEKGNQNIWIPNVYLNDDGTVKTGANIDFVFKKAFYANKFKYAEIEINPLTW